MRTREALPLEELYFEWLIRKAIWEDGNPVVSTYVFRVLHKTPFEVVLSRDENRAVEGLALRAEFFEIHPEYRELWTEDWAELECSIFEMLVALSIRSAYQTGDDPRWWFAIFAKNMGLRGSPARVKQILERFNRRMYSYNGDGGLFPLQYPETDQRETELWYQLAAYIHENGLY